MTNRPRPISPAPTHPRYSDTQMWKGCFVILTLWTVSAMTIAGTVIAIVWAAMKILR